MPLSKDDRIAFSKKIVEVPFEVASIEQSKNAILIEKGKAEKLDIAHKNLTDTKTVLVDAYQLELTTLDGNSRTTITETDIQNAASYAPGNFLYPTDPNSPPPSTAPQVWTKTKPYSRNKGVGKLFNETFGAPVTKEPDLITAVQSSISTIESTFDAIERVTGQKCTNGTCSLPIYDNSLDCTTNGGVWTPGPDAIVSDPAMVSALNNLITQVNTLRSFLISEAAIIYLLDSNAVRQGESQAALTDINNTISIIDAWLALNNFNTSHGQTTCAGFYAYNPLLLGPTKMRQPQIDALKNELIARASFVTVRAGQLNGYLGTLTQSLSTGDVTGSGLYFERWSFLQLRLNLLGGSLIDLKGYDSAINAQNDQISNILSSKATYELLLTCSIMAAPGNGTKFLHLKSAVGFSVGDTVYIVTEDQPEIQRNIEAIDGNRLTLGQPVPANYRESALGRVYKDLT
jgi:hypothetical protein